MLIWIGSNHLMVGHIYNNLGNIHQELGTYAKAKDYYDKALIIYNNKLDHSHPDIHDVMINLAILSKKIDNDCYNEAKRVFSNCLQAKIEAVGSKHPDVANGIQYYYLFLPYLIIIDNHNYIAIYYIYIALIFIPYINHYP